MKTTRLNDSLEIYLPENDNDGFPLDRVHYNLHKKLLGLAGGYTETKSIGRWIGPDGKTVFDDILIYSISCNDLQPSLKTHNLIQFLLDNTKQKAIFYKVNGFAYIAKREK